MKIEDIVKSIILGIISQTESNSIKWLNSNQYNDSLGRDPKIWNDKDKNLDHTFHYVIDSNTEISVQYYLLRDQSINRFWMTIKSESLQDGNISFHVNQGYVEVNQLRDLLYEKFIKPKLSKSIKSYQTDVSFLENLVSKCGIEAVRDMKVNKVLSIPEKSDEGWLKKLFN